MDFNDFLRKHGDTLSENVRKERERAKEERKIASREKRIDEGVDQNAVDAEYWNTMNPATGLRYAIPLLDRKDPQYFFKYVNYMKIREASPDTFAKIMSWE